jgi:RHS repeat-associated protein
MTYDATAALSYSFDQENRLTGANGYTYSYDADGNRVRKSNGNLAANGTLYWEMTPGVVAETDLAGTTKSEYIFFDGERVARRDGATGTGGVFYYFSDNLKTASVVTDSAGTIKAESDYYSWGGELQFVNNDSNDYKFTGKKRDTETGLDYFGARYYSNGLGRFITPDWAGKATAVPYSDFADPQSLNLYSYVRNVPTTKFDLDGHDFAHVWEKIKEAVKEVSVKTTIGLGLAAKAEIGPAKGGAEIAVKANATLSVKGKLSVSQSVEAKVSASVKGKEVGLGVEAEQVKGSVNLNTGEVEGPQPATGNVLAGIGNASGSSEGSLSLGYEEGVVAVAEAEVSISKEGIDAVKDAFLFPQDLTAISVVYSGHYWVFPRHSECFSCGRECGASGNCMTHRAAWHGVFGFWCCSLAYGTEGFSIMPLCIYDFIASQVTAEKFDYENFAIHGMVELGPSDCCGGFGFLVPPLCNHYYGTNLLQGPCFLRSDRDCAYKILRLYKSGMAR